MLPNIPCIHFEKGLGCVLTNIQKISKVTRILFFISIFSLYNVVVILGGFLLQTKLKGVGLCVNIG